MTDLEQLDALTAQFFSAFDNRSGAPAIDRLTAVCLPEVVVSKCVGNTPEVMSLDAFIAPRRRWLTDGTLVDFHEWETGPLAGASPLWHGTTTFEIVRHRMDPNKVNERVFKMSFAGVYPHYVNKVEKKGRTVKELDQVICWLTGYDARGLKDQIARKTSFETFFAEAPKLNPNAVKITGTICGVRIDAITHPLMKNIRYMDKLVDELAKGRPMEKILRG